MLPVFLYVCETRSLTLREGHRLRVCENGVLGKIFGLKRVESLQFYRTKVTPQSRNVNKHGGEVNDIWT